VAKSVYAIMRLNPHILMVKRSLALPVRALQADENTLVADFPWRE